MATKSDIDYSYSTMDKIWRLSIGEMADFTGAKYDGDFSLSLEEAQKRKHQFISEHLNITGGSRVLDMGCGWGPFLNYLRSIGAKGLGLTLSQGQFEACKKNGLDVRIKDCRTLKTEDFGTFDAVASVGAFEHFCSIEEYKEGRQDEIYQQLFKTISDLLPKGGRCFIQTMVFGEGMIDLDKIDIKADKNSNEYLMALIVNEFPGSWLPYGQEHIIRSAQPYFKFVCGHSGKDDYIETIKVWRKRLKQFSWEKYAAYLSLAPRLIYDSKMRNRLENLKIAPIRVAFERGIWDHFRLVFEKV
ncbi:SAM-dependent methyltransferase [Flexithrix dorotheae]|uniref:SAM-dependent methyltransferase n=1 Tax=Flexithrix dorotheae TaxID=70993 RepID=UPI00037413B5|nr:class I SAM-dependent methyltransferase [Flexithrix dorotheae]